MTRDEACDWLFKAKWVLVGMGYSLIAADVEQAEILVYQRRVTVVNLREHADYLVAPGRRGRITLVLHRPVEARALAFAAAVLRAVED